MKQPAKQPLLLQILKILGLFSTFLILYPLCYLSWFLQGRASAAASLVCLGATAASGFLGAGLRLLAERKGKSSVWMEILLLLPLLPIVAAFFSLYQGHLAFLLTLAAVLAAYVMGNREVLLSYGDFASPGLLHAVLISYGIGAALIFLSKRLFLFDGEYTSLAGVLFAFFAVYAAICNQAQIDELMRRRGHRMDQLPARIRRYNLLLIVLCIAVALALLVFYRPLAAGIRTIWDIAASLILWLARAIQALLEALFHQEDLPQEQLPQGENSSFFPAEEAQSSLFWNIPWVLIAVGAVVLLVRNRHAIASALRQLFARIGRALRQLFAVRHTASREEEAGYVDTVESIDRNGSALRLFSPSAARLWKRRFRALRKLPEGTEKLRTGYALLAEGLLLAGADVQAADTPQELLQRAAAFTRASLSPDGLALVMGAYERVRYDEQAADAEESAAMQSLLAVLARLL